MPNNGPRTSATSQPSVCDLSGEASFDIEHCNPVQHEFPVHRNPTVSFVIALAGALHQFGTPTDRLEAILTAVTHRLGVKGQFFAIPTGIFASFGTPEEQRTALIRVEPSGNADLEKMSMLDELTNRVIGSDVTPADGIQRIEEIVASPSRYGKAITVLAYGLVSGSGSRFFGGGWREAIASTFIGLALGLLSLMMEWSLDLDQIFEPAAALLVSVLAIVSAQVLRPVSITNLTLSGLFFLFPGLTLTLGIRELASRNLVSGTAQLTAAGLVFLELGFGVALGVQLGRLLPVPSLTFDPIALPGWTQWLALLISPPALAILLRAKPSDIGWIMLACFISFGGARAGTVLLGPELGVFLGALLIAVGSNMFSRRLNRPSAITLVPGMLLLVPGSVGFTSLSKFLLRDVVSGVETAFRMVLIAIALVTGLLLAGVLVRPRQTSY